MTTGPRVRLDWTALQRVRVCPRLLSKRAGGGQEGGELKRVVHRRREGDFTYTTVSPYKGRVGDARVRGCVRKLCIEFLGAHPLFLSATPLQVPRRFLRANPRADCRARLEPSCSLPDSVATRVPPCFQTRRRSRRGNTMEHYDTIDDACRGTEWKCPRWSLN